MLCFPNCKINIGLYVVNKRTDGFHNLETVFFPLPLYDVLEIVRAGETQIHISGLVVEGNVSENLVWKAYRLMQLKYPVKIGELAIYLHKVIPMGAGLGGGSADAAFMLSLLNNYYQLKLSDEELSVLALQLGSDCPFFIKNKPVFAKSRGENLQEIAIDLSRYSFQLIVPEIHISTPFAFSLIKPKPAPFDLIQLSKLHVNEWKLNITNDFEEPIFKVFPDLSVLKQELYHQGAVYASMTGSGSTIYGIFPKGKKATFEGLAGVRTFYIE